MEMLRNLEVVMASWYKNAPHLPEGGRRWLAANVWWLDLIGVILGSIVIVGLLLLALAASAALVAFGGVWGAAVGGVGLVVVLLVSAAGIACVVLGAMAISPLKAGLKKGWTLLFATLLLSVAVTIVDLLFAFDLFGFLWNMLILAVIGYFMFEIRDRFIVVSTSPKKTTAKKV